MALGKVSFDRSAFISLCNERKIERFADITRRSSDDLSALNLLLRHGSISSQGAPVQIGFVGTSFGRCLLCQGEVAFYLSEVEGFSLPAPQSSLEELADFIEAQVVVRANRHFAS